MNPMRIIYEDTPDSIPIPEAFRHRKTEIIVWPLDSEDTIPSSPPATASRRSPPAALAGKVRELGDVMSTVPASD